MTAIILAAFAKTGRPPERGGLLVQSRVPRAKPAARQTVSESGVSLSCDKASFESLNESRVNKPDMMLTPSNWSGLAMPNEIATSSVLMTQITIAFTTKVMMIIACAPA
jgi:hypothetical protein